MHHNRIRLDEIVITSAYGVQIIVNSFRDEHVLASASM